MAKPYISLHQHTEYSLLDGACKIDELIETAAKYEMDSLAITDHGVMFGVIPFYKKCTKAGIKPIIGQESYIAPGKMTDRSPVENAPASGFHLILLAKDNEGYKNLMEISSAGFLEGFYYKPRVDKDFLAAHSKGLIAMTACLKGEVPYRFLHNGPDSAKKALGEYIDIFGKENVYIEIMDHGIPDEKKVLPMLTGLSVETGIPLAATTDAHYLHPEDWEFHDILLCVQTGSLKSHENRMKFGSRQVYFRSPEEMEKLFAEHPEAIENTREIATRCNVEIQMGKPLLPRFPIPEGYTNNSDYIRARTFESLEKLYGEITPAIEDRANYELSVIAKMGFLGYYAIVADFTDAARERGVRVGPGRGSGAASIVAYALGITNVDPLKYHLVFERFLNPERISMPDFDIDFEDTGRDRVIDYVREKYGEDAVAQIITFNFMKARSAIKNVGRVLEMPYDDVDKISKLIPAGPNETIDNSLETVSDLRKRYEEEEQVKRLIDFAKKLEGLPSHAGKHAAGVVITPGKLTDYVPLFRTNKDEMTTQYDWISAEDIGVVKMDFLGLKTLSILSETERIIEERTGEKIDCATISFDDEETFKMISHGDTLGIFQFESEGMTKNLRKLHPNRIEDMIAMNALYRPGPMQFIDSFIARKHGHEKIEYPHELIEEILRDTYGIIVYQEQVMQIAQAMAGFSLGKADILRRAMGKKKHSEMMAMREEFAKGAKKKGIDDKTAAEVFDMMAKFAEYGFNKAHATAYSIIAYQTAFLKCHHRLEFTVANMNNEIDNSDKLAVFIEDAKHHNIEILQPDVNASGIFFIIEDNNIRYALSAIKNVGRSAAESIVEARAKDGQFENIYDFCQRVDLRLVNRRALENLVHAGAMDSLAPNRASAMATIPDALAWAAKAGGSDIAAAAGDLFESSEDLKKFPETVEVAPLPRQQKLKNEKEVLGLYLSGHPLNRFSEEIAYFVSHKIEDLANLGSGTPVSICGLIVSLDKTITKRKKEPMAFGSIEDLTGQCSFVVFPEAFRNCSSILAAEGFFMLCGTYNIDERGGKVAVDRIIPLDQAWEILVSNLHIRFDIEIADAEIVEIKEVLEKHGGRIPTRLHIVAEEHTYRATSNEFYTDASKALVSELREILGDENVWVS